MDNKIACPATGPATQCFDPTTDTSNCGSCGHVCSADTPYCLGGSCTRHPLTIFAFTGANQTFNVPSDVSSIKIQMWAGAGGRGADAVNSLKTDGGAGGYTAATVVVTPGESLTIMVGGGGIGASTGGNPTWLAPNGAGWPDGGGSSCTEDGAGGGRSALRRGSAELVTAGGGGGGGSHLLTGNTAEGGAGGGVVGDSGLSPGVEHGGAGGTTSAGGAGGTGTHNGAAGSKFQGGQFASDPGTGYGSCGGGGGYYGGGTGSNGYGTSDYEGGCGGGSGYVGGAGVSAPTTTQGTGPTPANVTDANYVAGVAVGGGNTTANGGNGLIIIQSL